MQRWVGRNGDPITRVQQVINRLLAGKAKPSVLEAGCGSLSRIELPEDCKLIGIDISARQLERNTMLDEKILGDIQTYALGPERFDLIVSWDVIEHLSTPNQALDNMIAALRPGGALLLAFPNFWSLKGLITKFTPFGFHAWFYRWVLGDRREVAELDQFPTFFRRSISLPNLRAKAAHHNLAVLFEEIYEGPVQTDMRHRNALFNFLFAALGVVSRILTLGRLDLGLSDCILVLQRPALDAAHAVSGTAVGLKGMPGRHLQNGAPTAQRLEIRADKPGLFNVRAWIKRRESRHIVPAQHQFSPGA